MNNFDQTEIECAIGAALRQLGLSKNVYYNRPRSKDANLKDFVVCKVVGSIRDYGAFGMCTVAVYLYAQDVANMKNAKKLSLMQGKLKDGIEAQIGNLVLDCKGVEPVGDVPDEGGYHLRIIQLKQVIIKIV